VTLASIRVFIIFEKTNAARKFIQDWIKGRNTPSFTPKDPTCPTLGWGGASQKCGLHEQSVFNQMLEKQPELEGPVVQVIPVREKDRPFSGVNTFKRDGCMKGVVQGWNEHVEYPQDNGYPDIIARKGDTGIQAAGVPRKGRLCDESKVRALRRSYLEYVRDHLINPPRFFPVYHREELEV